MILNLILYIRILQISHSSVLFPTPSFIKLAGNIRKRAEGGLKKQEGISLRDGRVSQNETRGCHMKFGGTFPKSKTPGCLRIGRVSRLEAPFLF